jgi:hypothetical protein
MRSKGLLLVLCCAGCFDLDELTMGQPDGAAVADLSAADRSASLGDLAGPEFGMPDLTTLPDLVAGDLPGCKNDKDCGGGTLACCGGSCVDTSGSTFNCGGCDQVCAKQANATVGCVSSNCKIVSCNPGFGDCDGQLNDGCEQNILGDAQNCGACGHVCSLDHANTACVNDSCVIASCEKGFADCDANPADGCEVDIVNDPKHCGGCAMTNCGSCFDGGCVNGDMSMPDGDAGGGPDACGPVLACRTGQDPVNGNAFTVCGQGPRIAQTNNVGNTMYYVDLICQCFGFAQATSIGTDVLNACANSCMAPGPYIFGLPPCGFDGMGRYFCASGNANRGLEWMCK